MGNGHYSRHVRPSGADRQTYVMANCGFVRLEDGPAHCSQHTSQAYFTNINRGKNFHKIFITGCSRSCQWQLLVQPVMKIISKCHFHFSVIYDDWWIMNKTLHSIVFCRKYCNYDSSIPWLHETLTHLHLDKMATVLQTIFSWMKNFKFWLEFHWSLFLRVQLTITQHWFR